jgi:Tol biopolymer transport system component
MRNLQRSLRGTATTILLAGIACGLAPNGAAAQYFGRNKVQYQAFRFDVLHTEHFHIYYYAEEKAAASLVARMAERWYARHAASLQHQLHGPQPLILYASHPQFEQTNAISGELDEATGGVTEVLRRRIVLPLAGPLAETDHVIGHELVHAFQYDITGEGRGGNSAIPSATRMPLWFIEGMAEYLSLGPKDPNTTMWVRDAALRHKLPSYRQLFDERYFPYRYGQAFLAYLASRYGENVLGELLRTAGRSGDIDKALLDVTKEKPDSLVLQWHDAVQAWVAASDSVLHPARDYGRLLEGDRRNARLNVAPALSPDGSRVAFFSDRGLFSIQLYLADARTGKVQRTLVKTAVDQHYESLEFINSAGAWDATGHRFAFGAVTDGRPVLTVLDARRDRVEREIPLKSLGEIFSPTWAPDGHAIAFSALVGGLLDLFVYDLQTNSLRRLTNDAYADLQPAWSPDGRSIAFATDRFTTNLTDLRYGPYRLALYDVASGAIRPLRAFDDAKHINPQWSPDGSALYFVSDHGGISNAYRLELATGALRQVTNLTTGLSGITALSPAISVAGHTGAMMFTAFEQGDYHLYAVDRPDLLAGTSPVDITAFGAGVLPPPGRADTVTVTRLADATTGLPSDTGFAVKPYSPGLSLEYVAPPSLGVGVDRFGAYLGGGTALYWGDLLGDRTLLTGVQVNGTLRDLSAVVGYQNLRHRLNWGVVGQQVPYVTGQYAAFCTDPVCSTYVQQIYLARQTNRSVSGMTTYPISRVQRVEFSLGYNNISFNQQLREQGFDGATGRLLYDSTVTLPSPNALNLAIGDVALVYDNSYFGATSPILGQRYRLDLSPMVGSLVTTTVIADYRRYLMPVRPFTLAARVMHVGRYGRDAEDLRLTPLFLGYSELVRGYGSGSFSPTECVPMPKYANDPCLAYDRLFGSRLLVGNLELRFPLLGVLHAGSGYYGALPIEAALFADGGVSWCGQQNFPCYGRRSGLGVASAGVALRINLLGFAVGELDWVHPFQRPGKGSYLEFSLTPGF